MGINCIKYPQKHKELKKNLEDVYKAVINTPEHQLCMKHNLNRSGFEIFLKRAYKFNLEWIAYEYAREELKDFEES